ncbi:MAG: DUF4431 domain-containing protein [Oxalobacteraceae bacterium]|nr:MAG: DUF4431 domain-containing protein [Oxalobacteraceae bacterium]
MLCRTAGFGRERSYTEIVYGNLMLRIVWKVLCISLISCTALRVSACEKYGLPDIMLVGTVTLETFYGPPGYGESPETDSKERQAILHLAKPLCTLASGDEPAEQDQAKVTLVPMDNLGLQDFVGKVVAVRGSLFHAITGHHHTDVLIATRGAPMPLPAASLR